VRPNFWQVSLVLAWFAGGSPVLAVPPEAPRSLEQDFGRNEVRVLGGIFRLPVGRTVEEIALPERLERLGYRRVKGRRPAAPGEFFWGNESFWIYRQAHWREGEWRPAEPVGVKLGPGGRVVGPDAEPGKPLPREMPYLEGEVLAESLDGDRAPRWPIRLDELPERVWRALLAIEDARFFDHPGVDYRGIARALLANLLSGKVAQGGSTLTQQLVKMRDLTPKRTLGRKVSEAIRAVALEAEYDKREILESYLNHVYYGHVGGLAVHGIGAASRAYLGKTPEQLSLEEAALLAGIIQSPNRLAPDRHPSEATARRNRVLERLAELKWASPAEVAAAKAKPLRLKLSPPTPPPGGTFYNWVTQIAEREASERLEKGRGVIVETHLDPLLQVRAEQVVAGELERLRRSFKRLRSAPLSAALVALDGRTGAVLAYVGGRDRGGFDRVRSARRQPGSTLKPLMLLEAFERCGERGAVFPATRVVDRAVEIELTEPGERRRTWKPTNNDGKFRGLVTVRQALEQSLNVPFVRLARWCGFEATADRLRQLGIPVPTPTPPAFSLGAVEVAPLELARAYTAFVALGEVVEPWPLLRISKPEGWPLARFRPRTERVASSTSAWLARDLMRGAIEEGSARQAALEGVEAVGKTGTSSERRDAWFAGTADGVVAVVWLGLDTNEPLGLTGAEAAAPLWRKFMDKAARWRGSPPPTRPDGIVEAEIDTETGLRVDGFNFWSETKTELFRRGALPRRDHWFWFDDPEPVVE
jgi:penicillin-binding protein 1B